MIANHFWMEPLIRQNTKSTPYVHFDAASGTYVIGGRSIPIDAEIFYKPILNWIDRYAESQPINKMELCLRFDFFNIASSKRILFIMYRLLEMRNQGWNISIKWMYERNDADMLEIGQDYSFMLDELPFTFEEFDTEKLSKEPFLKLG